MGFFHGYHRNHRITSLRGDGGVTIRQFGGWAPTWQVVRITPNWFEHGARPFGKGPITLLRLRGRKLTTMVADYLPICSMGLVYLLT